MSRLNYHHLYYFWQVASQGNLTQVANKLHVSQSALSNQIRQLEESMGTALFERRGRKLVLTESGQRVLVYAQDIFSKGEELESLMRRGITPEYQHVRIGVSSTMSRNFIEGFISPLLDPQQYTKARFSLHARSMTHLLDGLVKHQFDLILTNAEIGSSEMPDTPWQSQLLARQPLSIVGPPDIRPNKPFPDGYKNLRWVLPADGNELRRSFDGFCAQHQFQPDLLGEADDMAMLRLLARDSCAVTVLPKVVVKDEIRQGALVEYMTLPNIYENFYAVTVRRQYAPALLADLLKASANWKAE